MLPRGLRAESARPRERRHRFLSPLAVKQG